MNLVIIAEARRAGAVISPLRPSASEDDTVAAWALAARASLIENSSSGSGEPMSVVVDIIVSSLSVGRWLTFNYLCLLFLNKEMIVKLKQYLNNE